MSRQRIKEEKKNVEILNLKLDVKHDTFPN